jgi:protein SCO1/2
VSELIHDAEPRRRRAFPVLAGMAALLGAWACGPGTTGDESVDARLRATGYSGIVLPEPPAKPDFVLTDTEGRPFDFRQETEGRLTLLFFGFTHCPDICPVHMANLGAVLDRLDADVRRSVQVVFVSVDPDRDTPERIRAWLDAFHPSFVGLRGDFDEVNRIQAALNLAPAMIDEADAADGAYPVGHSAQVLAFTPDGFAHVTYPFGIRQQDWLRDLPKLVDSPWAREGGGG